MLALTACSDDAAEPSFDGCGLVSRSVAAGATGAEITRTEDESSDDGTTASFVGCRYLTEQAGAPAMVIDARVADNRSKAEGDIAATQSTCTNPRPLDLQGVTGFVCEMGDLGGGPQAYATWDGYVVHAALTTAKDSPEFARAVEGLKAVVEAAHDNLTATTFTGS